MRNDPKGASDCRDDTRAGAARKAGRHRVKNPGAGRNDDDERCQQECGAEGDPPTAGDRRGRCQLDAWSRGEPIRASAVALFVASGTLATLQIRSSVWMS